MAANFKYYFLAHLPVYLYILQLTLLTIYFHSYITDSPPLVIQCFNQFFLLRVPYEKMQDIWVPVVDFTNTKGIHITQTDHQATMVVNMLGKPRLGDDTQPEECECA